MGRAGSGRSDGVSHAVATTAPKAVGLARGRPVDRWWIPCGGVDLLRPESGGTLARVTGVVRQHRILAAVLGLAVLLRIAVAVAYGSALFYSDSWSYARFAYEDAITQAPIDRPLGYSLLLRAIALPARELWSVTLLQHLVGLATGVIAYTLLFRIGLRRGWAALGAAVVVLDAYLITLEHTLMPETVFGAMLLAGAFLLIGSTRGLLALAVGALLIGSAATLRTVGIFAIPVCAVYLLWAHRARPLHVRGLVLAALVAPVLGYSALHAAATGEFGMSRTQGWFLYGRVAEIAECGGAKIPAGTEFLCERTASDRRAVANDAGPLYWIWSGRSPARRRFPAMTDTGSDAALGSFAKAIIRDRPGRYAGMVAGDFARFFEPGVASKGSSDVALVLPARPRTKPPFYRAEVQARFLPSYEPRARAPSGALRAYAAVFHTPRWLLAVGALLTLTSVFAALVLRVRRLTLHREAFLLTGMAIAMLLAAAATSEFVLRYLIPMVPLLITGGAVAATDLFPRLRRTVDG